MNNISVVVPVYNGARYLRQALDSILAQTYLPIEIIVADDGSTDDSVAIAESMGGIVRAITQPTAGPAATRNFGARAAAGDFLAFLDADDLWHPEKLRRQIDCFEAETALDYCITHAQMFWATPEETAAFREQPRAGAIPGYATTTLLTRRSAFERVGFFDENLWFADATDWFMRADDAGLKTLVLPDVLTYHRMHDTNLTRRRSDASRAEFLHIVRAAMARRNGRA